MPASSVAVISASELKGTDMLASRLLTVASSLQRWNDELKTLSSLPSRTPVEASRLVDLRASIDAYESFVSDIGPTLPKGRYIDRANA